MSTIEKQARRWLEILGDDLELEAVSTLEDFRKAIKSDLWEDKDPRTLAEIQAERRWNERLGELTREAFAGAWRADVEAFEMHSDTERLPEVERLLGRAVRQAARGAKADAIDSARSAAAACREVPALAADVARIVAILEAT